MTTTSVVSRRLRAPVLLAALLALSWGAAVAFSGPAAEGTAPPSAEAIAFADQLSAAFRGAAAAISPSVVSITTVDRPDAGPAGGATRPEDALPEGLRRFFGFGPGVPFGPGAIPPERRGQGSGVIVRADGYILTNNHVVQGADELRVRLQDGRELAAAVVGTDRETDLAVVRVTARDLPAAPIGDSDAMQPGDWIVAVGNPFGLDHTVTAGVVSAVGRGEMGLNTFEDFIQTDAAINPGNSGGPMVNLHGQVIGINSAIRSAAGGNNGIGFAIPANLALHVADALIDAGRVERGWLGVSIQPLTPDLAASFGDPDARGALVAEVVPDTPASQAGLEAGDIITRLDDRAVDSPRALMNLVARRNPGERIALAVARDGHQRTLQLVLGERPGAQDAAPAPRAAATAGAPLGVQVEPVSPAMAAQLGLDDGTGLVVADVVPGSAADRAGLRPRDVILEVARRPATSARDLGEALDAARGGVLLRILREGRPLFLVVRSAP